MLFSNELILDDKKCVKIFTAPVGSAISELVQRPQKFYTIIL
ncbi:hypothetical protein LEP1GSC150_1148 [Leptospira interrogans serovar Copenhageni str. LT2050]|uniref:Uncharacterized protein n=1 Tax=Leptospira interrogans serovar Copenhageni str. LT2050 TaxID=1001598 RepID=M3ITH1_LEPIT|nr:hypothetical protein LEP1GSC150_1148 [Leptospira interrogans serovar Copenhageni str. LT2050]